MTRKPVSRTSAAITSPPSTTLEQALLWADQAAAEALAECESRPRPDRRVHPVVRRRLRQRAPRVIAEYELFLYAARHPAMMPTARRWLTDLSALVDTWTESRARQDHLRLHRRHPPADARLRENPTPGGRRDHPRPPLAERSVGNPSDRVDDESVIMDRMSGTDAPHLRGGTSRSRPRRAPAARRSRARADADFGAASRPTCGCSTSICPSG